LRWGSTPSQAFQPVGFSSLPNCCVSEGAKDPTEYARTFYVHDAEESDASGEALRLSVRRVDCALMPQKGDRIVLDGKAYVTNAAKESQGKVLIDIEDPS
jgi:hypothetical protein